ncbi:hypothetical protein CKY39_01970 [Variovorax boronicumulans]|uniref:Uncharacterized protein n=1 Tax=Variovorax boronicumulans TaxID=436515 RepID=A0A250DCN3_9BURK|nr:hypothetical protein [Variovorax boronicumulans]ATA52125.1 hypothetical protein CKY39_01970 [Variovorax boronicumulans]
MKKSIGICNDLQYIIEKEMELGNEILSGPEITDWPARGSVFAALKNDLNLSAYDLPATVRHEICTDPRFGWHDECKSVGHADLLVAGNTHFPK